MIDYLVARLVCLILGHNDVKVIDNGEIRLWCLRCGRKTKGWKFSQQEGK